MDLFVTGAFAGLALAIPLGPMAILLISTTISEGFENESVENCSHLLSSAPILARCQAQTDTGIDTQTKRFNNFCLNCT